MNSRGPRHGQGNRGPEHLRGPLEAVHLRPVNLGRHRHAGLLAVRRPAPDPVGVRVRPRVPAETVAHEVRAVGRGPLLAGRARDRRLLAADVGHAAPAVGELVAGARGQDAHLDARVDVGLRLPGVVERVEAEGLYMYIYIYIYIYMYTYTYPEVLKSGSALILRAGYYF